MQIVTEQGKKVEFNQEKHVYIHNNEYVVGMSTILGKLASPMLENWKINNMVNAIKKEMERQEIPIDKIQDIVLNAKTNAKKQNDGILNIGSMVHKFCEMWLKGEKFTSDNIRSVRPGYGLSPDNYFKIIGRRAKKNIRMFEPIKKSLVD